MATTVTEAVLTEVARDIHNTAVDKGFWEPSHPTIGELNTKLLLIVSEISEAMEVLRREYDDTPLDPDTHMTEYQAEEFFEEVIDVIIRAFDLAYRLELSSGSVAEVITAKMRKNRGRPRKHGKRF